MPHDDQDAGNAAASAVQSSFWYDEGLTGEARALDETFIDAFRRMAEPAVLSDALEPKVRELIGLAVNSAVTHLHSPAIESHIEGALAAGATEREILEVLQITSVLGCHAVTVGLQIVREEMAADGDEGALTASQQALKQEFTERRGYWTPLWEPSLREHEEYLAGYLEFSAAPWDRGELEPKVREFVYIANDASSTHLHEPGIRAHARNAIRYGATRAELLAVLELTSLIGMQSYVEGANALAGTLSRRSRP